MEPKVQQVRSCKWETEAPIIWLRETATVSIETIASLFRAESVRASCPE